MLYLIAESRFKPSPWYVRCYRGLVEEARKRRLTIKEIDTLDGLRSEQVLFVLGATESWFKTVISQAYAYNVHPISLTNCVIPRDMAPYSSVTMDLSEAIRLAIDYLTHLGRQRIALYGVNPSATSDLDRATAFRRILTSDESAIIPFGASYSTMFDGFVSRLSDFDGIICCNDFAAVSLIHNLSRISIGKEEMPYIVSFGNTWLSRLSKPSITSISDDYEHFGSTAFSIYNMLQRDDAVSEVHIQLRSHLNIRESTGNEPYVTEKPHPPSVDIDPNPFYEDRDVTTMLKMEMLFLQSDDTDFQLMHCIMANCTYTESAEQCFISEATAKYRIKKMKELCGVESRRELADLLRSFME